MKSLRFNIFVVILIAAEFVAFTNMPGFAGSVQTASLSSSASAANENSSASVTGPDPIWGKVAVRITNTALDKKWHPVATQQAFDDFEGCLSALAHCAVPWLRPALQSALEFKGLTLQDKLTAFNAIINKAVLYRENYEGYGVIDYWASPLETTRTGYADCKGIVILKMALLKQLGFADKDMFMVLVHLKARNIDHAVIVLSTQEGRFVLDSLQNSISLDQFSQYDPIIALNAQSTWMFGWRHIAETPKS